MTEKLSCMRTGFAAGLASIVITAGAAFAGDTPKPSAKTVLPGVSGDYRIVKPMEAEPVDDAAGGSQFKIGDVDVRISGEITVDIGAGSIRPPRH